MAAAQLAWKLRRGSRIGRSLWALSLRSRAECTNQLCMRGENSSLPIVMMVAREGGGGGGGGAEGG